MGESFIQLPGDGSGKKTRSRERDVGLNTIHEQYVIPISERVRNGFYHVHPQSGILTESSSADAFPAGDWFLVNTSSSIIGVVRKVSIAGGFQGSANPEEVTRLVLQKFTFTGSPSGGTVSPAKADSGDATAVLSLRTAGTGMTMSDAGVAHAFNVNPSTLTGSGTNVDNLTTTTHDEWEPDPEEMIILRQNQGLMARQADAGSISVNYFWKSIAWEEYTLP